ncbi:aminomethyl transferase family protein [Intrasporangium sp.]|uniref:aminomethyl transferase family protein n=1 Tax=Intrasporangium sp. TaxID=1925024 RepID=UPI002939C387|nr:aminomethyl transferase family protein [Intrasporangium sp.]MDV3221173.1 aminomethyl transferase family protein [Intrasporangium sp.]
MTRSIQSAIDAAGGVVTLLRNQTARAMTFPVPPEFTNWRTEQAAWRQTCVLFDQSHHMTDLFISGPDAVRLLSDFGVNGLDGFRPGQAKQYVATNADGHVIGDAILFHLEDGLFDVVGHPTVPNWLEFNAGAGRYDVAIERDENSADRPSGPPKEFRYELQGPNAAAVMEAAGAPIPQMRFFTMADFEIAGVRVRGLRHGMAGQPGVELFGPWSENERVLDALLGAGRDLGLVRAGAKAYSTANLESGWVPSPPPGIFGEDMTAYRQWLPADAVGALAGSMDSPDITDYLVTPYELGYGKVVRFDHDFHGRDSLEAMQAPHRTKVTLVWNADDVASAFRSLFHDGLPAKYLELPKARYGLYQADKVVLGGATVGMSMDLGYLVNEHAFVSLAVVDTELAPLGTEVHVLWGESPNSRKPGVERHEQVEMRAVVAPAPFVKQVRDTYRAPSPQASRGTTHGASQGAAS